MNFSWQVIVERFTKILRTNREAFVSKIKTRVQYFNDNSTLQSFGYVISLTNSQLFKSAFLADPELAHACILETQKRITYLRLFWLVTLTGCCYCSGVVLRGALGLYTQDAVSYSVETDYLDWNTPFPALTVCETANTSKIKRFVEKKFKTTKTSMITFVKEIAFWNIMFCKSCTNCKMGVNCVEDFIPLVELARSPCEEIMSDCSFDGEEFPCCDRFKPVVTEYGVCFAFNSHESGEEIVHVNRTTGLPALTFTIITRATIKVHAPDERINVPTENLLGELCYNLVPGMDFIAELKVEEIVNDVSVRTIAPSSRDCLFDDEFPQYLDDWPFEEYSYSDCIWYCRTMAQIQMCNCSYHFMPKIENVPVCNIQGLKCLSTNRKSIQVDKDCHCPMSCSEVTYSVVYGSCAKVDETRDTIKGFIKIAQLPHLRVRRQAIRDMLGLVVDIGGVIGVFFGASLLSFLEIVYIFCIRKF